MIHTDASLNEVRDVAIFHLKKLAPQGRWENVRDPLLVVQLLREIVVSSSNPEDLWMFHMEGKTEEAENIFHLCEDAVEDLTVIDEIYKRELNRLIYDESLQEEESNWL